MIIHLIRHLIRICQKVFLSLFLSCFIPIDLALDVIKYFTPDLPETLVNEASVTEEVSTNKESNHYLLIIIPVATILITIVGGVCDLHLDNLLLSEAIE